MGHAYKAVGWNRQKKLYDFTLLGIVLLAASVFGTITALRHPGTTAETFIIRFTAVAAFLLLHVILAIGPLARLDGRFLPLLYNRRHLGVTMALLALVHGVLAVFQFHALGDTNPLVSVFTAYDRDYATPFTDFRAISQFPFEIFGVGALAILFVMAATSHDFWLRNLGPSVWKTLHQLVYVAYALLLAHVLFGALQSERSPVYPLLLGLGFVSLVGLHLLAARKERALDRQRTSAEVDGFIAVGKAAELREGEGKVVVADGRRFALFLQGGRVFALSNVCRHQGGPIGEGRIVSGCITCPWHGFQYKAEDGCSPPPFTEVLPTYPVLIVGDVVLLSPQALPLGAKSEGVLMEASRSASRGGASVPAPCAAEAAPTGGSVAARERGSAAGRTPLLAGARREFYIGWQSKMAPALARFVCRATIPLAALVPLTIGLVTWFQHPVDRGRFEFGLKKQFEGILFEHPIPRLRLSGVDGKAIDHILVGAGKFGPPAIIAGAHGKRVRFSGSLIVREPLHMIELNRPDTFTVLEADKEGLRPADLRDDSRGPKGSAAAWQRESAAGRTSLVDDAAASLGTGRFVGELVDTKCYTGVMRPATGKVHRGCAIRCLSGGVPPGLLVCDARGDGVVFFLAGPGDEPLRYDVQLAGTLIEVEGSLELHGDTPVLRVTSLRPR
ncbi:MAG: Rieske 2Fe-2S domain-containing protein [Verrucomicrobiales bacterium]